MAKIVIHRGYSAQREIEAARVDHHDTFTTFFDGDDRPLLELRTGDIKTLEWEWDSQSS